MAMHFQAKPVKNETETNQIIDEQPVNYCHCIIENIICEVLTRLKIFCQILCCVPLDEIFVGTSDSDELATKISCCSNEACCGKRYDERVCKCDVKKSHGEHSPHQGDKIRIIEPRKQLKNTKDNSGCNQPDRNQICGRLGKEKDSEKNTDRCLETRSSSIKLYSTLDKIRLLKELQITETNIDKLINGKIEQTSLKEYRSLSIETTEFQQNIDTNVKPIDDKLGTLNKKKSSEKCISEISTSDCTTDQSIDSQYLKKLTCCDDSTTSAQSVGKMSNPATDNISISSCGKSVKCLCESRSRCQCKLIPIPDTAKKQSNDSSICQRRHVKDKLNKKGNFINKFFKREPAKFPSLCKCQSTL